MRRKTYLKVQFTFSPTIAGDPERIAAHQRWKEQGMFPLRLRSAIDREIQFEQRGIDSLSIVQELAEMKALLLRIHASIQRGELVANTPETQQSLRRVTELMSPEDFKDFQL